MGESIGIGLAASSTSKSPQAKTMEPMDSIKVTYCSIQLVWILAIDPQTLVLYSSTVLVFSKYRENDLTNFDEINILIKYHGDHKKG